MPNITAIDRHKMNIHLPLPMFNKLKALQDKTGMSYTEFMVRITQRALADYQETNKLPPNWRNGE